MAGFDVQKVRRQAGAMFDGFTSGQKAMFAGSASIVFRDSTALQKLKACAPR